MRIAIVGTGISGLAAAHRLRRWHDLVLFEADDRIGGHTHTHQVEVGGQQVSVDTGFIVFNDWTYPRFIALLEELDVAWQFSDMSFSVRSEQSGLEYNGTNLDTLFAQRRNLFRPEFLGMVRSILRFNKEAPKLLEEEGDPWSGPTLGELLERGRYGEAFERDYILPMGAAIWSATRERMLAMPARFFVRFFVNHGMLSVSERPTWRTVTGGSSSYIEPLIAPIAPCVRLNRPVERIKRDGDHVLISSAGETEVFDHVILACHSDQALGLLADPSEAERDVLGALPYQANEALLHTDASIMPRSKKAWAAWNYHLLETDREGQAPVAVTYWMNKLQDIDASEALLVSLNRSADVDPSKVLRTLRYHHPVFTREGVRAQGRWEEISGVRNTSYCGAYWFNGFHEDGVRSGERVAEALGAKWFPGERDQDRQLHAAGIPIGVGAHG